MGEAINAQASRNPWSSLRRSLSLVVLCCLVTACQGEGPAKARTVTNILALHETSLGSFARADFVQDALVQRQGRQERVRITVRFDPFAYREDWVKASGRVTLLSDGNKAWGGRPKRGMGAQTGMEFVLLKAPLSRALLERAFLLGRQYLDAELWQGQSGVDAACKLEAFPHQGPGFETGRAVQRVHLVCPSGARLQFWVDAEDGRLWAVTEPEIDGRWQRFGQFEAQGETQGEAQGEAQLPRQRRWGLFDGPGGSSWQLHAPHKVEQHAAGLFPFPTKKKPAWRKGARFELSYLSTVWHRGLMIRGLSMQGQQLGDALLDTGASLSSLQPARIRSLGLHAARRTRLSTIADQGEGLLYWFDDLRAPSLHWTQDLVLAVRLGRPLWEPPDRPVPMVFGGRALFHDAPVLDFVAGRLQRRGPGVTPLAQKSGVGPTVEIPMRGDGPGFVPLGIADREVMALVDTGWSGVFLFSSKAAVNLGLPTSRKELMALGGRPFTLSSAGKGQTTQWDLRLPLVRLGPIRWHDVPVSIQDPSEADKPLGYEALIGCGALARFRKLGFDTKRHRLEIETGMTAGEDGLIHIAGPAEDAGVLLKPAASSLGPESPPLVHAVVAGSAAAEAGFAPGDVLISLDGRPCGSSRLAEVCQRLEEGFMGLHFRLQRGARLVTGRFGESPR